MAGFVMSGIMCSEGWKIAATCLQHILACMLASHDRLCGIIACSVSAMIP